MKIKITWTLLGFAVAAIPSCFIHPFGTVKQANSPKPLFVGAQIESPILNVMRKSCANCHSEQTDWPWYSYVPPASWMVDMYVREVSVHFILANFTELSTQSRYSIL